MVLPVSVGPPTPALLSRQLEFQVRVAKELADQLAASAPVAARHTDERERAGSPPVRGARLARVPLAEDSKVPIADSSGFREATTDHGQIAGWWKGHPDRNIGVATGERSFDVLDIDKGKGGKPSGFKALNELQRAGLIPQYRSAVETPGGGLHLIYKGTGQRSSRLPDHSIDLRAEGGYVVVAPSKVDGRPYVVAQRNRAEPAKVDWQAIVRHLQPQHEKPAQHSFSAAPDKELERSGPLGGRPGRGEGDRNGSCSGPHAVPLRKAC